MRTARRLVSGSIVLGLLAGAMVHAQEARIAVIIDDVGHQLAAGRRSIALPGAVVLAILPHTPFARTLAEEGAAAGKEILVHMPMRASDPSIDAGPGTLELTHDQVAIHAALNAAISAVPYAIGVSNHMGSGFTRDRDAMGSFMQSLAASGEMLFVDSYTTHLSVGLMLAREYEIPSLRRDVFLDVDRSAAAMAAAWNRLLDQARSFGFAIAIAHPHARTLEFLEQRLAELADVQLVSLHGLLAASDTAVHERSH